MHIHHHEWPIVLKLSRAAQLIDDLRAAGQDYIDIDPVKLEIQDERGEILIKIVKLEQPPPAHGLLFGDAINQLRSCLDHAVARAIEFHRDEPLSYDELKRVSFPICVETKEFANWASNKRLPAELQEGPLRERIMHLQPCYQENFESLLNPSSHLGRLEYFCTTVAPHAMLLSRLREWSNHDKHRALTTCAVTPLSFISDAPLGKVAAKLSTQNVRRALHEGDVIARLPKGQEMPRVGIHLGAVHPVSGEVYSLETEMKLLLDHVRCSVLPYLLRGRDDVMFEYPADKTIYRQRLRRTAGGERGQDQPPGG